MPDTFKIYKKNGAEFTKVAEGESPFLLLELLQILKLQKEIIKLLVWSEVKNQQRQLFLHLPLFQFQLLV